MTEAVVSQRSTVSSVGFVNPLNLPANAEADAHVKVYGDDVLLTQGVDYTLDGVGDTGDLDAIAGVDVTIDADVLLADVYTTFTVEHDPPADQDVDISSGGTFGRVYQSIADATIRRVQAFLQNRTDRSLRLPVDAVDTDIILPIPEDRRGLVWELDQDTGDYRIVNTASDPDTEPLTSAVEAQAAAELAEANAEAAAATAQAQALLAADSADRAEVAAATAGDLTALLNFLWPVGAKLEHFGRTAPANFLACDGAAVSRTTYSALWAALHSEATVTVDTGTDLFTWTAHGLAIGDTVRFTTTGVLPTGVVAGTTYYIVSSGFTANAFKVATSLGGSAIDLTGTPSGVHTAFNAPYGYGDGSTTFNLPTWNDGRFTRATGGNAGLQGQLQTQLVGTHGHTASLSNDGAHTHTYTATAKHGTNGETQSVFRPSNGDTTSPSTSPTLTTTSNGDHTHTATVADHTATENRPANSSVLVCIKY